MEIAILWVTSQNWKINKIAPTKEGFASFDISLISTRGKDLTSWKDFLIQIDLRVQATMLQRNYLQIILHHKQTFSILCCKIVAYIIIDFILGHLFIFVLIRWELHPQIFLKILWRSHIHWPIPKISETLSTPQHRSLDMFHFDTPFT